MVRDIVVVVGVDRSGSSLCTNLIKEFGIDLGGDLLGPNEFNQRGYFESAEIYILNEGILAALGRSWDELYGVRPMETEWWRAPAMQDWLNRIVLLLQTRMGRGSGLFGLKDPRFCVLLPLWQEAFAICGLSPRYVLTLRRPSAVARSLAERNGFSAAYAHLYWLERYCFAIEAIRDAPHRVIDYENWFTAPQEQAHSLLDFLGLAAPVDATQQVHGIVDRALRHDDCDTTASQFETVERLYLCLKSGILPQHSDILQFPTAEDISTQYSNVLTDEGTHELRWKNPPPKEEAPETGNPLIELSGADRLAHCLLNGGNLDCDPRPLFDASYYLQMYPEVKQNGVDPVADYIAHGAMEGRCPNPLFDSAYYLERYPDVKAHRLNPLGHYILYGAKENRDPHPLFSTALYKTANPEIELSNTNPLAHYLLFGAALDCDPHPLFQTAYYRQSGGAIGAVNPLVHYLSSGWSERRNPNPLFHTEFYLSSIPGVRGVINPLVHYCTLGEQAGVRPSSLFDGEYYRARYADIIGPGDSLLAHYLHKGGQEGKNPNPLFDGAYYRESYPDIGAGNPLVDYLNHGWQHGRCPHPLFDTAFYLQRYPDVNRSGIDPLVHYIFHGGKEGRDPHLLFDASYYLDQIAASPGEGINPLIHYLEHGAREGLDPHPLFHTKFYLEQYPDVAASGANPLVHYIRYGGRERRDPNPLFSGERYFAEHLRGIAENVNPLVHFITEGAFYDSSGRAVRLADDLPARVGGGRRWKSDLAALKVTPLVSILLPVYNTPRRYLTLAIESVLSQTYPFWELCIVDDGSGLAETRQRLESYIGRDVRIRVVRRTENGGISRATNQAMGFATGEWIAMLDHDDELAPDALLELVKAINQDLALDAVYSDQDLIEVDGTLAQNYYKPDWSPELMLGVMYVGHLLMVRTSLAREIGGFDPRFDNVQDFEFMLRVSERTEHIGHVSKVLYHWRKIPGSIAAGGDEKPGIEALQAAAVSAHMGRRGMEARAVPNPAFTHRLMILPRSSAAKSLTLVVDIRNVSCGVEAAISRFISSKHNIQVLVEAGDPIQLSPGGFQFVDHTAPEPWFKNIQGDYLAYVDGTLEPCSTDWLDHLLLFASNPQIGCVAPILLRGPNKVSNAGLILKSSGEFAFSMADWPSHVDGHMGNISCAHNIAAVSGECWVTARDRLEDFGFNVNIETLRLQGVDLSLRCLRSGYRNVCNPRARFQAAADGLPELFESLDGLLVRDLSARMFLRGDPYNNPNLDISEFREQRA